MLLLFIVVCVSVPILWWTIGAARTLETMRREANVALEELLVRHSDLETPKLEVGWSYGYPWFKIVFSCENALAQARSIGFTDEYVEAIQRRFADCVSTAKRFDARHAVYFYAADPKVSGDPR